MLRRLLSGPSPWLSLFTVTAAIEVGAGVILLCAPSAFTSLVLGGPLESPVALAIARIGGAGLIALGGACWIANGEANSRAAKGLIAAMLFYNLAAVVVFAYVGVGEHVKGLLLWPSAALHSAMTIWCALYLFRPSGRDRTSS